MKPHGLANALWPLAIGVLLLGARLIPPPREGALSGLPVLCPFKLLFAHPCPGCGMTRALVLSAHGDWAAAFHFHPLGPVLYVGLWCAALFGVLIAQNQTLKARVLQPRVVMPFAAFFFAGMIAVWILRISHLVPFPTKF